MMNAFRKLKSMTGVFAAVITLALMFPQLAPGQAKGKVKGWAIECEEAWISSRVGYHRFRIKVTNNTGKALKDDTEFQVVITQSQNGQEHALTSKSLVIESGKTSAETYLYVNKTSASYNDYMHLHVEQDGNLHYEQRDLMLHYIYSGGLGHAHIAFAADPGCASLRSKPGVKGDPDFTSYDQHQQPGPD